MTTAGRRRCGGPRGPSRALDGPRAGPPRCVRALQGDMATAAPTP